MKAVQIHIHCCACNTRVLARLTNGKEIYPSRPDLEKLPFWICDACKNYVGCHRRTSDPTRPLGVIPSPEIRELQEKIHARFDPLWKSGKMTRKKIYSELSKVTGYKFHTAEIASISVGMDILQRLRELEQ